jgi:hypothetical protein
MLNWSELAYRQSQRRGWQPAQGTNASGIGVMN